MIKKVLLIGALFGIAASSLTVSQQIDFFPDSNQEAAVQTVASSPAPCKCSTGKIKVFLIGGQGSTGDYYSSQFFAFINNFYAKPVDPANPDQTNTNQIEIVGLAGPKSTGISPPTNQTLDEIATGIADYIKKTGDPVHIWSYSLGALYTPDIIAMVKAKLAAAHVDCYSIDDVLIDPPRIGPGVTGQGCVAGALGLCGLGVFNDIQRLSPIIMSDPGYLDLSGGNIIGSTKGSILPNANKHYPFPNQTAAQKEALQAMQDKFNHELLNICVTVKVLHAEGTPAYAGSADYAKNNPGISAYGAGIKDVKDTEPFGPYANSTDKNGEVIFTNLKAGENYMISALRYFDDPTETYPDPQKISPTQTNKNFQLKFIAVTSSPTPTPTPSKTPTIPASPTASPFYSASPTPTSR